MVWFVYIVSASDASLYTGITTDILKRIAQHNRGKCAKSLLGKLPVRLVYKEQHQSKSSALKREYELKTWSREKKQLLIHQFIDRSQSNLV